MPEFNSVRLIASKEGFQVIDSSGKKLAAAAIDCFIRPGAPPMIMLALAGGQIDIAEAKALFAIVDPTTGKPRVVRKIVWADGGADMEFPVPEKGDGSQEARIKQDILARSANQPPPAPSP
jgi:hypothetical protein